MQFKKVNFESMKLGEDTKICKTYTRQVEENSRLTQFIGNEPLCESEHGGEPIYKESLSGIDYLEPVSKHQAYMHEYAMQVQQVLNPKSDSDDSPVPEKYRKNFIHPENGFVKQFCEEYDKSDSMK